MKYLLIDTANTFFRSRYIAARGTDAWTKVGLAFHITLGSVLKPWRQFNADHVVFMLEGRSWRKDYYAPYKRNRADTRSQMTVTEAEEDKMFWEAYDQFVTYLNDKTNATVLRHPTAEADDLIARWIANHPDDEHVIVSSDTDFYQLIAENVSQFNGITNQLITLNGYFDDVGKPVKDKKTGEHKLLEAPDWILFEKCMRGDPTDNVFSAYPGVRTKGSKNKVGLTEAYADRNSKGFSWNNLMLQRWVDHDGVEHRVLDDYERNRVLIDLKAQPDEIRQAVDATIREQLIPKEIGGVGTHFLKFCGRFELTKLSEMPNNYVAFLSSKYKGNLI